MADVLMCDRRSVSAHIREAISAITIDFQCSAKVSSSAWIMQACRRGFQAGVPRLSTGNSDPIAWHLDCYQLWPMLATSRTSITGISRMTPTHQVSVLGCPFLLIWARFSRPLLKHAGTCTAASCGPCWYA